MRKTAAAPRLGSVESNVVGYRMTIGKQLVLQLLALFILFTVICRCSGS